MKYEFTVILERDEAGNVIAICPALQGCHTAADTEEEALDLIQDAIRLHLEARTGARRPINEEIGAKESALRCEAHGSGAQSKSGAGDTPPARLEQIRQSGSHVVLRHADGR